MPTAIEEAAAQRLLRVWVDPLPSYVTRELKLAPDGNLGDYFSARFSGTQKPNWITVRTVAMVNGKALQDMLTQLAPFPGDAAMLLAEGLGELSAAEQTEEASFNALSKMAEGVHLIFLAIHKPDVQVPEQVRHHVHRCGLTIGKAAFFQLIRWAIQVTDVPLQ